MAIVKTGVVLKKRNDPGTVLNNDGAGARLETIYGDLHIIGNCAVLYYPKDQVLWGVSHGWIDLDDGYDLFQRDTLPFHVLVIPAGRIVLRSAALHEWDLPKFLQAGGVVDATPGEMG